MPKSYVPKGLRSKIDALLASIVPRYALTKDGRLSTNDMSVQLYEGALVQLLDLTPSNLTASEFERCAWKAIRETVTTGATTCTAFDEQLDKAIEEFKRKPASPFRVCSRCYFSVPSDYKLDIDLWSARLSISQDPPEGLAAEHQQFRDGRTPFADPEFGAYLTMTVYERTKVGTLNRATKDIAFLLGILNFTLNLGGYTFTLFGSGEREMDVKLFPGGEVFLLKEDGSADIDQWQYYTAHPSRAKTLSADELQKLARHTTVIDRLQRLSKGDRPFYRGFFELYFDALTELDSDNVVMRLWKAAEHITMGQKAQHIANRLAITWEDREAVSAVCYALGQRRNLIMHDHKPAPRIDSLHVLFRHFLENSAWKSLSADIKGVAHWKTIMQMSDMDLDLDLAGDTVDILKALR